MRLIMFILSLTSITQTFAQKYQGENLSTVFLSEAPLNTFEGVSENLIGLIDLDKNLVDFYVDLNTLDTGIGLRDRHMRDDYLETQEYPYAEFTGRFSDDDLENIKKGNSGSYTVEGKFSVHGVERIRETELQLDFIQNMSKVNFETELDIELTDHKIKIPKLLFYELSNDIKITSSGMLTIKK